MRSCVIEAFTGIAATTNDAAIANHDRANRNLANVSGKGCFVKRKAHEISVRGQHGRKAMGDWRAPLAPNVDAPNVAAPNVAAPNVTVNYSAVRDQTPQPTR